MSAAATSILVAPPSPSLPTRGRVWFGAFGSLVPRSPSGTLPLVGRDGEGASPGRDINRRPIR
jgi:hypothetical protein